MCARRNDLVGTFLRVQSKRANDISLCTANNVADIKIELAKERLTRYRSRASPLPQPLSANDIYATGVTIARMHYPSVEADF
jgi:hypothetical protein